MAHSPIKTALESEIARLQAMISSPQSRATRQKTQNDHPGIRPRRAATMVLVDGEGEDAKVLMGKRNRNLRFMPGAFVFPGGSVDRFDGSVLAADEFAPELKSQLINNMGARATPRAARALGLAAIRETAEESGLLLGAKSGFTPPKSAHHDWLDFAEKGIAPSLQNMALMARAITPPGMSRRFDTWFFVTRADSIAHTPAGGFEPSGELEELRWISPRQAIEENTREITRVMLVELMQRLKDDPALTPGYPAPLYFFRNGVFNRKIMLA